MPTWAETARSISSGARSAGSALPVRIGSSRAAGGKSHSWLTPTTWSPAPSANRISVPLGTKETIRRAGGDAPAAVTVSARRDRQHLPGFDRAALQAVRLFQAGDRDAVPLRDLPERLAAPDPHALGSVLAAAGRGGTTGGGAAAFARGDRRGDRPRDLERLPGMHGAAAQAVRLAQGGDRRAVALGDSRQGVAAADAHGPRPGRHA